MLPVLRLLCCLLVLLPLGAQVRHRSRIWLAGQEAGDSVVTVTVREGRRIVDSREFLKLERLGTTITQSIHQRAERQPNGDEHYRWSLQMSDLPMEGEAFRFASDLKHIEIHPVGGTQKRIEIPDGALVWPEDVEAPLKEIARHRSPARLSIFSFPLQQWDTLVLEPTGPAALPGHADTVRFKGNLDQGPTALPMESWISPTEGEVKQVATLGGIPMVMQAEDLPAPQTDRQGPGFFAQTLQELPPHPLLYWLDHVDLRWTGQASLKLPEDAQQKGDGSVWRLRRAPAPTPAEAQEPPVQGTPTPEDRPFLAPTPLVQHQDSCFAGLELRLQLKPSASRWDITRAVVRTVFDYIQVKDMSVGFASALEVCRNGRGDCTEHGVLAVALLRRQGVPARGVLGWVGLDTTLGLHFWVEVKLGERWVPVDPTFDQAPASALRLKLGTTDLADLASVGWDQAAAAFTGGRWVPADGWTRALRFEGSTVTTAGLPALRLQGGRWRWNHSHLEAILDNEAFLVRATLRPSAAHLEGARLYQGPTSGVQGWLHVKHGTLWVSLPGDRWLEISGVDRALAMKLLDGLSIAS